MDLIEVDNIDLKEDERHPWERARAALVCALLQKSTFSKGHGVLVDIGSGDGWLLSKLAQTWPSRHFWAVDTGYKDEGKNKVSPSLLEHSDRVNLVCGVEDIDQEQGIDQFTLFDVLEHISDDQGFLRKLKNHRGLHENTELLICVPALQSLYCRHDKFMGHCRRYTLSTLKEVVEKAGWQVQEDGYFFASLLLPRLLSCLTEKFFQEKKELLQSEMHAWRGPKWIAQVLTLILKLDFFTGRLVQKLNLPWLGLSCFVRAKMRNPS